MKGSLLVFLASFFLVTCNHRYNPDDYPPVSQTDMRYVWSLMQERGFCDEEIGCFWDLPEKDLSGPSLWLDNNNGELILRVYVVTQEIREEGLIMDIDSLGRIISAWPSHQLDKDYYYSEVNPGKSTANLEIQAFYEGYKRALVSHLKDM